MALYIGMGDINIAVGGDIHPDLPALLYSKGDGRRVQRKGDRLTGAVIRCDVGEAGDGICYVIGLSVFHKGYPDEKCGVLAVGADIYVPVELAVKAAGLREGVGQKADHPRYGIGLVSCVNAVMAEAAWLFVRIVHIGNAFIPAAGCVRKCKLFLEIKLFDFRRGLGIIRLMPPAAADGIEIYLAGFCIGIGGVPADAVEPLHSKIPGDVPLQQGIGAMFRGFGSMAPRADQKGGLRFRRFRQPLNPTICGRGKVTALMPSALTVKFSAAAPG